MKINKQIETSKKDKKESDLMTKQLTEKDKANSLQKVLLMSYLSS